MRKRKPFQVCVGRRRAALSWLREAADQFETTFIEALGKGLTKPLPETRKHLRRSRGKTEPQLRLVAAALN